MKRITTIVTLFVFTALTLTSCKDQSLQSYIVSCQEKDGFITFDVPTSFLQLKSVDVSEDAKETLNSIHKINVVALPLQNNNKEAYEAEKSKIKEILTNSGQYKSLMRMNTYGMKMNIYYTGDKDAIDEVIAFGYANDKGVGLARILGKDMNPGKIIQMMEDVKIDGDQLNLKKLNLAF